MEETCSYRCLSHYYSTHYHKLLKIATQTRQTIIPEGWYKYTTMDVDVGTKRTAVKDMMKKWVDWERSTKKLYQEMRRELCNIGEVAAALKIDCFIKGVDEELIHAEKKFIKLESIGYDMQYIIEQSEKMKQKYSKG